MYHIDILMYNENIEINPKYIANNISTIILFVYLFDQMKN